MKDRPGTIHVFIHAPFDYRVQRIMRERKMAEKAARTLVEESDRTRMKFVREMTGIEWTDARNFHLSIDTSVIALTDCVEMIAGLVDKNNV